NSRSAMSGVPGGAVGCTSTGSARRSISFQTGANKGSVSGRPAMLARTMTPTAPRSQARAISGSAASGYSQGIEQRQRMPDGEARVGSPPGGRAARAGGGGARGVGARHVVVDDLRRLEAHVAPTPVHVRAREGDDRHVDPGLVHLLDTVGIIEVSGLRGHEWR